MRLKPICIPDWLGGGERNGVELGPKALLNRLRSSRVGPMLSDDPVTVDVPEAPAQARGSSGLLYLDQVVAISHSASDAVVQALGQGLTPLPLVSDDSAMMGVLSGLARATALPLALVWLDAHGDINTPETSPSGRLFGMPLAHLLGFGHPSLLALNPGTRSLSPEHLVLIGIRALDPGERAFIDRHSIRCYGPEAFQSRTPPELAREIADCLSAAGARHLHVHLDLDVLDPKESPGVSLREPDGLAVSDTRDFIRALAASPFADVTFSISEYNPKRDRSEATLNAATAAVESFVDGRTEGAPR